MGLVKGEAILSGLHVLMSKRRVDPLVAWLKTLEWDGNPRVENFFPRYLKVPTSPYTKAVSKNFWVALCARVLSPGIKFDSIPIVEGLEGVGKSTFFEVVADEYFFQVQNFDAFQNAEDLKKMHQSLIVELPELVGLIGARSELVKAFVAMRDDRIRKLYAPQAVKERRSFIFVGTTNENRYLQKGAGLRRFWPLVIPSHVKTLDLNDLSYNRNQLFAEGRHLFEMGAEFYHVPEGHLEAAQDKVRIDPLVAEIRGILSSQMSMSLTDIYMSLSLRGLVARGLSHDTARRIEDSLDQINCQTTQKDGNIYYALKHSAIDDLI